MADHVERVSCRIARRCARDLVARRKSVGGNEKWGAVGAALMLRARRTVRKPCPWLLLSVTRFVPVLLLPLGLLRQPSPGEGHLLEDGLLAGVPCELGETIALARV